MDPDPQHGLVVMLGSYKICSPHLLREAGGARYRRATEALAGAAAAAAAHPGEPAAAELWRHLRLAAAVRRRRRRIKQGGQDLRGQAPRFGQDGGAGEGVPLAPKVGCAFNMLVVGAEFEAEVTRAAFNELTHAFQRFENTVGGVALEAAVQIVDEKVRALRALVAELHQHLVHIAFPQQSINISSICVYYISHRLIETNYRGSFGGKVTRKIRMGMEFIGNKDKWEEEQ